MEIWTYQYVLHADVGFGGISVICAIGLDHLNSRFRASFQPVHPPLGPCPSGRTLGPELTAYDPVP